MPTLFRASLLVLAPMVSIALGCTSSNPAVDAGPGGEICPTTIIQATAAGDKEGTTSKCHVDGFNCVVGYQCGNFTQQAICTCTLQQDGTTHKFQCKTEANGTDVPEGTQDSDIAGLCSATAFDAGADPCPASATTGDDTPCKTPGKLCAYTGTTCTGDPVAPTDTCQCHGNANGDAGLSWKCEVNACQ